MQSREIQNEFNILPNATGIDKMVLDILLALDGFYFGRQTAARKCAASVFPSEMAFFFTSEAKPFAANVGVPFRRSPKIMFVVDKARVCAFSSSFSGSAAVVKHPKETAYPYSSNPPPDSNESVLPSSSPSPGPTQTQKEPIERDDSKLEEPDQAHDKTSNSNKTIIESPVITPSPSEQKKMKKYSKVAPPHTPPPVAKPQTVTSDMTISSPPEKKENRKNEKRNEDQKEALPSASQFNPPNTSQNPTLTENSDTQKVLPPIKPPKSHLPSPSKKPVLSVAPPFPDEDNEAVVLSLPAHSSPEPTEEIAELHSNNSVSNTSYIYPSSSPVLISLESSNMSDFHSDPDLYSPSPIATPTKAEAEVILGDPVSTCFPSFATVTLSSGRIKRIDELSVGEFVYIGRGISSRVIDFSHYDHATVAVFLRFSTDSGRTLTVTPSHFVYTDKKLIPAGKIVVGDRLLISDGKASRVLKISTVQARGLFNPHTLHGDVVVDGFIVSTYTLAAVPRLAHSLLAPIRFLHQLGFKVALLLKLTQHKTMLKSFAWALSRTTHYARTSL